MQRVTFCFQFLSLVVLGGGLLLLFYKPGVNVVQDYGTMTVRVHSVVYPPGTKEPEWLMIQTASTRRIIGKDSNQSFAFENVGSLEGVVFRLMDAQRPQASLLLVSPEFRKGPQIYRLDPLHALVMTVNWVKGEEKRLRSVRNATVPAPVLRDHRR